MNKLIGYYNGDEYGSDGWWEEGDTSEALSDSAEKIARESGFDDAPDLVEVETSKLSELTNNEWDDLHCQWRLARRNNWTSGEVDVAMRAEQDRRDSLV
jgi:hypothetical protein